MNYSELSDAQISQRVGAIISRDQQSVIGANGKAFIHHYSAPVGEYGPACLGWVEFDPCNSWADAGPIIGEENISLIFGFGHWDAMSPDGESLQTEEVNPLRAAMIVFLIMQEQPNA